MVRSFSPPYLFLMMILNEFLSHNNTKIAPNPKDKSKRVLNTKFLDIPDHLVRTPQLQSQIQTKEQLQEKSEIVAEDIVIN